MNRTIILKKAQLPGFFMQYIARVSNVGRDEGKLDRPSLLRTLEHTPGVSLDESGARSDGTIIINYEGSVGQLREHITLDERYYDIGPTNGHNVQ